MKISKLFHSLYALLMLAPVFAVGGAMAFNIINDKAVDNAQNEDITYQRVNYLYETNEVTSVDDIIEGHIYQFTLNNTGGYNSARFTIYTGNSYVSNLSYLRGPVFVNAFSPYGYYENVEFTYRTSTADGSSVFQVSNQSVSIFNILRTSNATTLTNTIVTISICLTIEDLSTFDSTQFSNFSVSACPVEFIPYTLVEETITYPDNLSDNFYYALDSMNNSEVFSWAKTSFLAEPFSYIFGLFGIPSGSPFITLLSYWLSISIIWLVFDLVMYVPLLVHGWIDKGGIE